MIDHTTPDVFSDRNQPINDGRDSFYGVSDQRSWSQTDWSWNNNTSEPIFSSQLDKTAAEESEACSPPLWKTSPTKKQRQNAYQSLSPESKAKAIARGQKELMDMVSRMPESSYELSLKDIVEVSHRTTDSDANEKDKTNTARIDKNSDLNRSSSVEKNGGFLLKMVFPTSLRAKKKKKNYQSRKDSNRATPPHTYPVSDRSVKTSEREWSKKKISDSGESQNGVWDANSRSTRSSNTKGNSRINRVRNRCRGGCWSFLWFMTK